MSTPLATELPDNLQKNWQDKWPDALACWSRYVKLSPPRWCLNAADEKREKLSGSFAMIRLNDHAVVISLPQIEDNELTEFAVEILAHEIGHHVYCPADLTDNARLLARTRRGLPTREQHAPMIANLYADLLINDRLQRTCNLNMAGVYEVLRKQQKEGEDELWTLYMRIYEILWSLPKGTLASGKISSSLEADAGLGARLVRSYARDWLKGAGRFAMLCLTYLLDEKYEAKRATRIWLDATQAGGDTIPDGLAEIDDGEIEDAIHPANDPALSGIEPDETAPADGNGSTRVGDPRAAVGDKCREPWEYNELLKALGIQISEGESAMKYYRERARPHLIRFPVRKIETVSEPQMEGFEEWSLGCPLEKIDWLQSAITSPFVVPGMTTLQRVYGETPGDLPAPVPVDLYLGIDCSGSMLNPQIQMSYPALAGAIMVLSALRAGARVKVVLSGEPGSSLSTEGFVRDENAALRVLTGYLGTGYAFGIHRLEETFGANEKVPRACHIIVVTDHDIFSMLEQEASTETNYKAAKTERGWRVAKESVERAKGGGTYVLHMNKDAETEKITRMKSDGWDAHFVQDWQGIISFAREFVRRNYERSSA